MNFRHNVKCNVCGNYFIVKVQGGFVEHSNVRFGCPTCRNLIKGEINQNAPSFEMMLENATLISEMPTDNVDIISISTELPVIKSLTNMRNTGGFSLSPYSAISQLMKLETVGIFRDRYLDFKDYRDKNLSFFETIVELFRHQQWQYVCNEIRKDYLPDLVDNCPKDMKFCTHLLSQVVRIFINKLIPKNYEDSYPIRLLLKNTLTKIQNSKSDLTDIHKEIVKYIDIPRDFSIGLQLIILFIKNVESFLPVIALSYGKGFETSFGDEIAITTFSFEDLRDNYKDCFELLSRTSLIYIGFSNFNRTRSVDDFSSIGVCKDLAGFYNTNNGNKKNVLDKISLLKSYYRNLMDNQIRNAIGHNKTEYLTVEQIIKYYPYADVTKKDIAKSISLVDFAYNTYLLNLLVVDFICFIGKWNYRMR